jgi:hypothetical protein
MRLKIISTILNISPIFKAPKTSPNNLLMIPKAAKSASLVKAFPANEIIKIMRTNVKTLEERA